MDSEHVPPRPTVPPGPPSPVRISALVVAGDAGATIATTLSSLLAQTLPPERVIVVVAGSRDDTFAAARTFNGRHAHARAEGGPSSTTVTVIDRGAREGSLRSAYGFAIRLVGEVGAVLLVSPDAELEPGVVELLADALADRPDALSVSARLDPRPSGSRGPLAGALRLLQRHWATGAMETGTDLGLAGPVPLAPAVLLRLPGRGGDPAARAAAARAAGPRAADPPLSAAEVLAAVLSGTDRSIVVPDARARVDTAVSWATLRERRDRWGRHVGRLARSGATTDTADRRRAQLASLRIGVGPVLRVVAYALAATYVVAAALLGTLEVAWWWAVPVLVRLPLQVRTVRRIRDRSVADVVFGATHLSVEAGEAAYGVSRIRDGLRRLVPRSRRPLPASGVPPFSPVDGVALGVLLALVVGVLALAAVGGPTAAGITAAVGVAACVVTAADLLTALLRLLVARNGPLGRTRAETTGGSSG